MTESQRNKKRLVNLDSTLLKTSTSLFMEETVTKFMILTNGQMTKQ